MRKAGVVGGGINKVFKETSIGGGSSDIGNMFD